MALSTFSGTYDAGRGDASYNTMELKTPLQPAVPHNSRSEFHQTTAAGDRVEGAVPPQRSQPASSPSNPSHRAERNAAATRLQEEERRSRVATREQEAAERSYLATLLEAVLTPSPKHATSHPPPPPPPPPKPLATPRPAPPAPASLAPPAWGPGQGFVPPSALAVPMGFHTRPPGPPTRQTQMNEAYWAEQELTRLLEAKGRPRARTTPMRPTEEYPRQWYPKWALSAMATSFAFFVGAIGTRIDMDGIDRGGEGSADDSLSAFFTKSRALSSHISGRFGEVMQRLNNQLLQKTGGKVASSRYSSSPQSLRGSPRGYSPRGYSPLDQAPSLASQTRHVSPPPPASVMSKPFPMNPLPARGIAGKPSPAYSPPAEPAHTPAYFYKSPMDKHGAVGYTGAKEQPTTVRLSPYLTSERHTPSAPSSSRHSSPSPSRRGELTSPQSPTRYRNGLLLSPIDHPSPPRGPDRESHVPQSRNISPGPPVLTSPL